MDFAGQLLASFSPYRNTHLHIWYPETHPEGQRLRATNKNPYRIFDNRRPETRDAQAHLDGHVGLALTPLIGGKRDEALVRWGALDIDNLLGRLTDPEELAGRVAEAKLPLVPARTKSGDAHLYLFLTEIVPASEMQSILLGCADKLGLLEGFPGPPIEVFPKNTRAGPKGYSPGLNLPYFGAFSREGTTRAAVQPSGGDLDLLQFFSLVERSRTPPSKLPRQPQKLEVGHNVAGHRPDDGRPPAGAGPELEKAPDGLWDIQRVVNEIWLAANNNNAHHEVALGVSGMLGKAGLPLAEVIGIIRRAVDASRSDREEADRVAAARWAYEQGSSSPGRRRIAKAVGETLTEGLYTQIRAWKRAQGHWKPKTKRKLGLAALLDSALGPRPSEETPRPPPAPRADDTKTEDQPADECVKEAACQAESDLPESSSSVDSAEEPREEPAISTVAPQSGARGEPRDPDQEKVERIVGSAIPPGGNGTSPPSDSEASRRAAVEILFDYLLGKLEGIDGPGLKWREGGKAYANRWGRETSTGEFSSGGYDHKILGRLLSESIELQAAAASDSHGLMEKAAIEVWKRWAAPAFLQALNHLPERGGEEDPSTLAERLKISSKLEALICRQIRYNTSPSEIPMLTSVWQIALETDSMYWTPVGALGVFVRMGPRIAITWPYIKGSGEKFWDGIGGPKNFGQLLSKLKIGKGRQIRIGGTERKDWAYELSQRFVQNLSVCTQEIEPGPMGLVVDDHRQDVTEDQISDEQSY